MARRAKPEKIITKLREVDVRLSQGESVGSAAKEIRVKEQSCYWWRKEYDGWACATDVVPLGSSSRSAYSTVFSMLTVLKPSSNCSRILGTCRVTRERTASFSINRNSTQPPAY